MKSYEQLKKEHTAMLNYIEELNKNIEKKLQKDGWCRLVVKKEDLDEMKVFFESLRGD